ncbi:S-adenosyl-L-methionine-dependent methyltransferase [Haematococcus lacustris]
METTAWQSFTTQMARWTWSCTLTYQTSEELMLAAKNGGNSPASLFHNFYKTEVCANQTRCSGVVLDIGASIGTHALYLAKLGYEVHAFEPQRNNTQLLRCSANAMGFRNLYVVQEGISDHIGTECLIEPTVTAMHLGIFAPRSLGNCSHFLPAAVNVVSLDHYWMNVLGKRQISFIKIDTEAHELYVLLGGMQLFAEMPPPMMLMEWYPKMLAIKNTTGIAVMQAIASAGYRVWDCQTKVEIDTTPVGVRVLSRYKESVTDLLLLHKSKYPLSQPLKTYSCGY